MREIVLDTETTGFEPNEGDRIVEIGAVELFNHLPTGRTYHQYINPKRNMPEAAFNVHGLFEEFLSDKPVFKDIVQEFIDFIKNSKLVIHNASFDMKFLNAELGWVNRPALPMHQAIDTLAIARRKFPGSPASLDALCRRFGIDNSSRTLHGALLDSEILAEVYLELVGGRQPDLVLSGPEVKTTKNGAPSADWRPTPRPKPLASRLSETEKAAHETFIAALGTEALWLK
jgi:DNA polymerase-3 subunit epsilon